MDTGTCLNCDGIVDIKRTYSPDYYHYKCRNCGWSDTQSSVPYPIDYFKEMREKGVRI